MSPKKIFHNDRRLSADLNLIFLGHGPYAPAPNYVHILYIKDCFVVLIQYQVVLASMNPDDMFFQKVSTMIEFEHAMLV